MLGALEVSSRPVLVTHANARALANLERNKTDAIIKAVAQGGGVIGASIYGPMCWDQNPAKKPSIDDYVRHLEHIVNLVGYEHVGFGTDLATGANYRQLAFERSHWRRWEGINRFNRVFGEDIPSRYLADCNKHSDLPKVTAALARRGWNEQQIRGYLGENFRRVLDRIWMVDHARLDRTLPKARRPDRAFEDMGSYAIVDSAVPRDRRKCSMTARFLRPVDSAATALVGHPKVRR